MFVQAPYSHMGTDRVIPWSLNLGVWTLVFSKPYVDRGAEVLSLIKAVWRGSSHRREKTRVTVFPGEAAQWCGPEAWGALARHTHCLGPSVCPLRHLAGEGSSEQGWRVSVLGPASHRGHRNRSTWLCSSTRMFTEAGGGPALLSRVLFQGFFGEENN